MMNHRIVVLNVVVVVVVIILVVIVVGLWIWRSATNLMWKIII